jgi:hypothetical protein
MQPHVQQTLTDIDTRIIGLQTFRAQLLTFFNETPPPENRVPDSNSAHQPETNALQPGLCGQRRSSFHHFAHRPGSHPGTIRHESPRISRPEKRHPASLLCPRLAQAPLTRSIRPLLKIPQTHGAERGTSRPAATPKPIKRSPLSQAIPTEAATADLEKKLADACKQRDQARSAGRETIVEMFQKEIDDLQAQIDAQ